MAEETVQEVKQETTVTGKVTFGKNGIKSPTPVWASWIFRIVFILTGVVTFIVLGDAAITPDVKVRLALYLKGLDMAVWAITRAIGVEISRDYSVPGINDQQLGA